MKPEKGGPLVVREKQLVILEEGKTRGISLLN